MEKLVGIEGFELKNEYLSKHNEMLIYPAIFIIVFSPNRKTKRNQIIVRMA